MNSSTLRLWYMSLCGSQLSVWRWHGQTFLPVGGNEHRASKRPSVTYSYGHTTLYLGLVHFRCSFPRNILERARKRSFIGVDAKNARSFNFTCPNFFFALNAKQKGILTSDSQMNRAVARSLAIENIVKIRTYISFTVFGTPHSAV